MDGVRLYSYGMGRGKALRVQLSRRDRQQLDQLLSGGLQPVRTVLRALALRQMDTGQATPAVAVNLGLSAKAVWQIGKRYQQGGLERALYDASRPGAAPVLDGEQRQRIIAVALQSAATRTGALDGAPADRRGDQTQAGTTSRARNHPGAAGKPRPEAVAGKKCGAWGSWTRSTSPAWRWCWGCMKSLFASGHQWSASTRSRWCCMPTPVPRWRCPRDERTDGTMNTSVAEPPTCFAGSSPRRDGTSPR